MNNPDIIEQGKATQFKKGQSGNPGGMTKEQRADIDRAAKAAARIRAIRLDALWVRMESEPDYELTADDIRLMQQAEDRSLGKAKDPKEISGKDGGPIRTANVDVNELTDEELAQVVRSGTSSKGAS